MGPNIEPGGARRKQKDLKILRTLWEKVGGEGGVVFASQGLHHSEFASRLRVLKRRYFTTNLGEVENTLPNTLEIINNR